MTEQPSPGPKSRPRLRANESAWLIVATVLFVITLWLAVLGPLLTKNPAGIPVGVVCAVAGGGIVFVVRRARRS